MYRKKDFKGIFDHFVKTLGSEEEKDGFITIYENLPSGDYGRNGFVLSEKCKVKGITLYINPFASITTNKGQLDKTIHVSLRCDRDDLINCFFFKDKKRYKILDILPQNGLLNNQWYHYDCIEG